MLKVTARYDDWGRGRGYLRKSADQVYDVGRGDVVAAINEAADELIDAAKDTIMSDTGGSAEEYDALTTYADSLTRIDGGVDFPRRRIRGLNGSQIRVALVAPVGGAVSADLIEFGRGNTPGLYPLTKALFQMGGQT